MDHVETLQGRQAGAFGEKLKSKGEEKIASEYGMAFGVGFMKRRLSAAHGVVVHAGKIVVDERVSVNELDGACRGEGKFVRGSESFCSCQDELGAKPFSAGKKRVTSRLD